MVAIDSGRGNMHKVGGLKCIATSGNCMYMESQSHVAKPYSTLRERVWDMAIKQLVAQEID